MSLSTKHRLHECTLIVFLAISVFLLISLLTYHSSDPGWSSSGNGDFISNAGGIIGAWFADIFLYLFGYVAYLFPIMLSIITLTVFYKKHQNGENCRTHIFLKIFGFSLILISCCDFLNLQFPSLIENLPLNAGGVLGQITRSALDNIFNDTGSILLLVAALLVGITMFSGLSWIYVFKKLYKTIICSIKWFFKLFISWRSSKKNNELDNLKLEFRKPIVLEKLPIKQKTTEKSAKSINLRIHQTHQIQKSKNVLGGKKKLPSLEILDLPQEHAINVCSRDRLERLSREVEKRLLDFGIEAKVVEAHPGPVITRFELNLAPGLKVNKVTSLVKDLARSLSVSRVRVVEVIPGKPVIGLEIPNDDRDLVRLREVLESERYADARSPLSLALGKDISGYPVIVDLYKMPHLLVAGTTGAGKSVSINVMLLSLLFKSTPEQVRFILVDPKMLELSVYAGIPHLLAPVVTDMKEAANAFRWCVAEMERRYKLMASIGVRNLKGFNAKVRKAIHEGVPIQNPLIPPGTQLELDQNLTLEPLPSIVVVVDELADMMMVVGKKVEELIARIAQKARAAGIHMILATQRPSVDVITGLIKANIPTRIAFQVSSRIDSRTILDQQGAEQLLGEGDMLYLPPGTAHPVRIHGAFVSDDETHRVVAAWRQRGNPEYVEEILQTVSEGNDVMGLDTSDAESDELYDQAVAIVIESRRASISYVQRRLKIGYNRAARILEAMEASGLVSEMGTNGVRQILIPESQ